MPSNQPNKLNTSSPFYLEKEKTGTSGSSTETNTSRSRELSWEDFDRQIEEIMAGVPRMSSTGQVGVEIYPHPTRRP